MLELTPDNTANYLRSDGWCQEDIRQVEQLAWGVSNVVLRVTTASGLFIVKQSRPQLRTRETWLSDIGRVFREVSVMQLLTPLLPAGVVPRVFFVDRANYAFGMEHAPPGATVWKRQLLAGVTDLAAARRAGVVLGLIHQKTSEIMAATQREPVDLKDRTVFVQLRVEPFYQRIRERCPGIAPFVSLLIEQLMEVREALCHGDFSPKNMLIHTPRSLETGAGGEGAFTLVDYETGHFGDPTMDLGFFLSHLLLKGVLAAPRHDPYLELTTAFWEGYGSEARFRPLAELVARGIQHCAVCLLARIDGTSPVDYLTGERQREAVRQIARESLVDRPLLWQDVLAIVEQYTLTL